MTNGYFADFTIVRRQRVHARTFVGVPFWTSSVGWRLGW